MTFSLPSTSCLRKLPIKTLPLSLLRHKLTIQCTDLPGGGKFGISRISTVIYNIFSGERQHFDSGESRNPPRYLSVHGVDFKIFINVSYFYFCSFFLVTVCLLTHCRLVNKKRTLLQTKQVSMYPVCQRLFFPATRRTRNAKNASSCSPPRRKKGIDFLRKGLLCLSTQWRTF